MTKPEFEAMVARFPYYENRWGYMSAALAQATELIGRHGLRTALELGAPVLPIIVGADVMDKKARPELDPSVSDPVLDATQVPWPVDDKAYDLFMALQVFEHLTIASPRPSSKSAGSPATRSSRCRSTGRWTTRATATTRSRTSGCCRGSPRSSRPGSSRGRGGQPPPPDLRVRGPARLRVRPRGPAAAASGQEPEHPHRLGRDVLEVLDRRDLVAGQLLEAAAGRWARPGSPVSTSAPRAASARSHGAIRAASSGSYQRSPTSTTSQPRVGADRVGLLERPGSRRWRLALSRQASMAKTSRSMALTLAAPARAAAMATIPPPHPMSATRRPRTSSGWSSTCRARAWPPAHAHAQYGGGTAGRVVGQRRRLPERHREPAGAQRDLRHHRGAAPRSCCSTMKARRSSGVTRPV